MLLPILFLFLNGVAAQETQKPEVNPSNALFFDKMDRLLAGQELQETAEGAARKANSAISQLRDILAKIEAAEQTIAARLDGVILEVQSVELIIQAAIGFNETLNQLQDDLQTVKGRQAAAVAISVCQLLLVIAYLGTIGGIYIVKCFKEQQAKQLEQNLELMESRLQERKSKRRSASRPPKEQYF